MTTNQQLALELRTAIAQATQRQAETQVGIDRMTATLDRLTNPRPSARVEKSNP